MKVLHVYKTYLTETFGGVEQGIYQICKTSSLLGVQNRILCLSKDPTPKIIFRPEAEVYRYKLNFELASSGFSFNAIFGFIQLSDWADIIHYHFPWPFADIIHLIARVRKPVVITYHSDIVRQKFLLKIYQPLMHYFLKSADAIVVTSAHYLRSSTELQLYTDKVKIIPMGLDKLGYVVPKTERFIYWRNRFNKDFFLFVGVLRYYKGLHILLDALMGTNLCVVIAGDGPLKQELEKKASQLKLNNVYFIDAISDEDKIVLLQLCKAFVFPSHLRSEAFGLSLLEAAMFGKPMISAEVGGGSSYINIDGVTGLIVKPNSPDELRHAMELINWNDDLTRKMGQNAERRYWNLFTAEKMVQEYIVLYKSLQR